MDQPKRPVVTFVYYSYTQQAKRVVDEMAGVFEARGYEVRRAPIAFTDHRWATRFSKVPFKHIYWDVGRMFWPQFRGATGEIGIPAEGGQAGSDLVVIGSPTWVFRTNIPIRSYLKSAEAGVLLKDTPFAVFVVCRRYWSINFNNVVKRAKQRGGRYVDGTHWTFEGGQIRSLLSLISYLATGENRERYLGIRIPPCNLQAKDLEEARAFATKLADGAAGTSS